jgi:hypothetical protein
MGVLELAVMVHGGEKRQDDEMKNRIVENPSSR